ncbi:hypothetical protein ACFL3T_04070 [Patescibacteria group bacterium]
MKGMKIFASILVVSLMVGCGAPAVEEEIDITTLQTDGQFNYVLSGFLNEYADTRLNFALIFNVEVESIGLEEHKKRIDENIEQWEKIGFYSELLEEYLEDEEEIAFVQTAFAQSDLQSLIDEPYPGESDFDDGARLMVTSEETEDSIGSERAGFNTTVEGQILKIANDAEKGEILKDIVKKMGASDVKEALKWLNEANGIHLKYQDDVEKSNEELEILATKVRNSAIFAGAAGLTVGGLYLAGASLVTASGTAGFGHLATAAGFTIGGVEFILASGKHGTYLLDSQKGQDFFVNQEEEFKKQLGDAKLILAIHSVLTMKLSGIKDIDIAEIPEIIANVKEIIGLQERIKTELTAGKILEVDLEAKETELKVLEAKMIVELQKMLPPGSYFIEGEVIQLVPGLVTDEVPVELPEADVSEGPTLESLRIGHYETTYNIDDILTNQVGSGTIVFDINEDGAANGTVDFNHSGTVTQSAGGTSVTSNVSSSFAGTINGNFNTETQQLELYGAFNGNITTETMGQSQSTDTLGKLDLTAVFSKGQFIGTMTVTSDVGHAGIANFEASAI